MLSVKLTSNPHSPTPLDLRVEIPVDQGIVGIMGASGGGKTTLLRVIAGLEQRYNGQISLVGATGEQVLWASGKVDLKPQQRNIGLVFQDARLFSHLTVAGNLSFALKRARKPLFTIAQVSQWFGLEALLDASVKTLSGGQKQRVAVARAVIHAPDLLLLDEPFVAVDQASRIELLRSLKQVYQATLLPMIFVSHDLNDIRQLCSQLLLMVDGQISSQGETFHLLNQLSTGLCLAQPIAATLRCQFKAKLAELPLNLLAVGEQTLICSQEIQPATMARSDEPLECVIAATDVSISLAPVDQCSIANCLKAQLRNISELNPQAVVVELALGDQCLYAQITSYSVTRLGLEEGMTVYALFKASAVVVIQ